MTGVRISSLPKAPYQKYALEAQRRGIELVSGANIAPDEVTLLGAIDMIRELTERVDALEKDDK